MQAPDARRIAALWWAACILVLVPAQMGPAVEPAGPTSRPAGSKYLLLDSRVVERATNAQRVLGTVRKEPRNPLFVEDKPWEVRFDNLYPNILYDEDERLYKCWYSPFIVCEATTRTPLERRKSVRYEPKHREMAVCYAVSRDGLAWEKPDLGITEFEGSKANNIVLRRVHGAGVRKDAHDPDAARRYKLFCNDGEFMGVAFSRDGLHWSEVRHCPEMQAVGDTHNNAFWDERTRRYVGFTRLWKDGQRIVGRTESEDFLHWTPAVEVLRGTPQRQTYAMPVFPYAGLYLGLLMILDDKTDCVDCELAWSPDTVHWERVCEGRPLIPRGPKGSFDWGCIYAAADPIFTGDEIRLYYSGGDDTHVSWRRTGLGLARLRPDGFAGLEPVDPGRAAVVVTRPVICTGRRLRLTADARGGSIRVEIAGLAGFDASTCEPVVADVTDAAVTWSGVETLEGLRGRAIQLIFHLRSARLYAFRFSD